MVEFKDRGSELVLLNELYSKGEPKLVVMYGRRRVGKTELLRQFLMQHKGLYLLGRQESDMKQLKRISLQVAEFFNDEFLKINPFSSWDAFCSYLAEKPRMPIVIDEFPYIVQSEKSITSILQDYWDNKFSKRNSFIILCGSSINMMEQLLGRKSPLYGRRTEQILLEPLNFKGACLFFPEKTKIKERIINFSILGGMPAYLLEFDFNKSLKENLFYNLLQKNKFLYQDVLFTLKEELKEPRNYFSILYSISKGNTKIGEIVNDTGLDKSFVNKYISVLIDLQLVERRVPITEKNPKRSRNGIYLIKDNFFRFWFRFVFENQEYIEQEKQEKLINEKIVPELDTFIGRVFEDIVISVISTSKKFKDYLFGRWWDRTSEADIVGLDKTNKKIIIGEVKFNKLTKKDITRIHDSLKEKTKKINNYGFNEEHVIICLGYEGSVEYYKGKGVIVLNFEEII